MGLHFTGIINLGDILIVFAVLSGAILVLNALEGLGMEHEMLIDDYCERKYPGVPLESARLRLLTRRRRSIVRIILSGGRKD